MVSASRLHFNVTSTILDSRSMESLRVPATMMHNNEKRGFKDDIWADIRTDVMSNTDGAKKFAEDLIRRERNQQTLSPERSPSPGYSKLVPLRLRERPIDSTPHQDGLSFWWRPRRIGIRIRVGLLECYRTFTLDLGVGVR